MKLDFIDLKDLKTSPLNVRKHGDVNGDDLIPSIRANGVLQPLLVRPNCEGYEVIAGQRRFHSCQTIAKEQEVPAIPCAIMEYGDDAKAIEASLAENIARLPMDELDQYEAFLSLNNTGQSIEDIADHFGVTARLVQQRLAIANLYGPILNAYRREEIRPSTIRLLTMASAKQQKAWFKLFKQDDEPPHWQLKSWLFGGEEISTENALFDLETYKGVITSDLFGEDCYFADSKLFWEHQSKAIAEIKAELEDDGWQEVILLDVGESWHRWDHVDCSKDKGGKVFIEVKRDGEVKVHAGLIHQKEAKRLEKQKTGETETQSDKPELMQSMQNYLGLHRHAAVRTELLNHQGVALRLVAAQLIAGSSLVQAFAEPQKANTEKIKESLTANKAKTLFEQERSAVRSLLDLADAKGETIVPQKQDWGITRDLHAIFAKLLELDDETVSRILTFVTAETLPAETAMVEALGDYLNVDMAKEWRPDEVFFDLLKDKEAINAMVKEIAGKWVADGNITETAKTQKQIIKNCLSGEREAKVKDWQPHYMAFPMRGYTKRQETISAITEWNAVKGFYQAA
ncbi:MAG: ParB/RepB/Spo0J family partition protein [Pseudomonadota bacterium]